MPALPDEGYDGLCLQLPDFDRWAHIPRTGHNEGYPGVTLQPGEGIAYVQSAAKGLSLLCCRSRSNNETEEIKERELALNATEQTRQFDDYVKYVKGTVARQPASNYWDLKQKIATYMALLWVLFGDRCDYFINLNKIHAVMDLPEVQQLRQKFSAEICRRIS